MTVSPISFYDQNSLSNRFKKISCLGSGGQGNIYEVLDQNSDTSKALKIANGPFEITSENQKVAGTLFEILDQDLSPHLTKIEELISVNCLLGTKLDGSANKTKGFFNGVHKRLLKEIFPRRASLMEKMEGDLEQIAKDLSKEERLAFDVQRLSAQIILNENQILPLESSKYRNILYKKLDDKDLFHGKKLQDFDFWKYTFGSYSFYLPKQNYLIKLADYEPWEIREKAQKKLDPEKELKNFFWDQNFEKISKKFPRPTDPNARIVEVFSAPGK